MSDPFVDETVDETPWYFTYTFLAIVLFFVLFCVLVRFSEAFRDKVEKTFPALKAIFLATGLHPKKPVSSGDAILKAKNDAASTFLRKVNSAIGKANEHIVRQTKIDSSFQLNCSKFKKDAGSKSSGGGHGFGMGGGGGGESEGSIAERNCGYVQQLLKERAGDPDVARVSFSTFAVLN